MSDGTTIPDLDIEPEQLAIQHAADRQRAKELIAENTLMETLKKEGHIEVHNFKSPNLTELYQGMIMLRWGHYHSVVMVPHKTDGVSFKKRVDESFTYLAGYLKEDVADAENEK